MNLHVYAITDRPRAPLPAQLGLDDAPLGRVTHRSLAAVVTRHASLEVRATEDALWRHEAVVEALMDDRSVLPARFGVVFSAPSALRNELRRRYDEFADELERLRGRVELGVRVVGEPGGADGQPSGSGSATATGSGRAYLLERLGQRKRVAERARPIHEHLATLAVDSHVRVLAAPRLLLSAAYLVDRERVGAFRRQVERLGADHPDLALVCTGPWPPYNFASTREGAG